MKYEFPKMIFENSTNIPLYVLQYGGTDRERDGHYGANFTVSVRHYKCAANLQKSSEISELLTDSAGDITLLNVRSTQLHTRSIC